MDFRCCGLERARLVLLGIDFQQLQPDFLTLRRLAQRVFQDFLGLAVASVCQIDLGFGNRVDFARIDVAQSFAAEVGYQRIVAGVDDAAAGIAEDRARPDVCSGADAVLEFRGRIAAPAARAYKRRPPGPSAAPPSTRYVGLPIRSSRNEGLLLRRGRLQCLFGLARRPPLQLPLRRPSLGAFRLCRSACAASALAASFAASAAAFNASAFAGSDGAAPGMAARPGQRGRRRVAGDVEVGEPSAPERWRRADAAADAVQPWPQCGRGELGRWRRQPPVFAFSAAACWA
jgi:hypothetical protein